MEECGAVSCQSVLIVEDDEAIREALQMALELEGYQVFTAGDGQEGLEVLERIPRPCLILLDFMLPVLNAPGFMAAKKQNDAIATIPVVLVSAYGDRAQSIGASGFVKKPIDFDSLMRFVKQHCGVAQPQLSPEDETAQPRVAPENPWLPTAKQS